MATHDLPIRLVAALSEGDNCPATYAVKAVLLRHLPDACQPPCCKSCRRALANDPEGYYPCPTIQDIAEQLGVPL